MSEMMAAVVLTGHGDLDKLAWHDDWPKPVAGPGEVVIKVGACGLNNTDVNTRTGWYSKGVTEGTTGSSLDGASDEDGTWGGAPITFPRVQGADVCGIVESVGADVEGGLVGKRVLVDPWHMDPAAPTDLTKARYYGSEMDGGFAEFAKARASNVYPVVSSLSDAELATFATSWVTAENMLFRAGVGAGDTVLITGASGGVGSALIQLTARRGATPIALAGAAKAEGVKAAGAAAVIDSRTTTLAADLKSATGIDKVSVVADVVGGAAFPELIERLERGGRYVCSGAIAGPMVALDLRTFYLNDLSFFGATIAGPDRFADLIGYLDAGELKPLLAAEYALKDFHAAQTAFMEKSHVGNIVVIP
ncbi:MAG: alcohol dehydrogenase family protein [Pseudomonadota bacterium]